jgi:hypothetical protein
VQGEIWLGARRIRFPVVYLKVWLSGSTSGPILTFARVPACPLANVRIKGPPANISSSGALDLTFALGAGGLAGSECQIRSTRKGGDMAKRKKRPAVRKRKRKSIARRKARKSTKPPRKRLPKRTVAKASPRKRMAKAKLKRGAKKARKKVWARKPPSTPVVETVTEIEGTGVREAGAGPEEPEESRSAPPESEEQ